MVGWGKVCASETFSLGDGLHSLKGSGDKEKAKTLMQKILTNFQVEKKKTIKSIVVPQDTTHQGVDIAQK